MSTKFGTLHRRHISSPKAANVRDHQKGNFVVKNSTWVDIAATAKHQRGQGSRIRSVRILFLER